MLVNLKKILAKAHREGFAIGAFNTPNLESVQAVISAAEKLNIPVIINHAQIHESIAPLDAIGPIMIKMASDAKIEVCVHLDHGEDLGYLLRAMKVGFTSVMYDGSKLSYEENTANTSEIVRVAHCLGISVEGELGRVLRPEGGSGDQEDELLTPEECYTNPNTAKDFVEATGIDALAIAFGTAHGIYDCEPCLDFNRIAEIRSKVKVPLVMHGGSGLGDADFRKTIQSGIAKINYFTYMSLAGGQAVKDYLARYPNKKLRFDEIAEIGRLGMVEDVENVLKVFGGRK